MEKMKYVKSLTEDEIQEVRSRDVERAKKAIGQGGNGQLREVGESLVKIANANKNGLYKAVYSEREVFYVVQDVWSRELAICYTIY